MPSVWIEPVIKGVGLMFLAFATAAFVVWQYYKYANQPESPKFDYQHWKHDALGWLRSLRVPRVNIIVIDGVHIRACDLIPEVERDTTVGWQFVYSRFLNSLPQKRKFLDFNI